MARRQYFTILLCCLLAPIFAEDCGVGEYKCENNGICIGVDKICDGTVDCEDNEEDEWTCEQGGECLGPTRVCDGIKDCPNNEDEEDCCRHSKLKFYNPSLVYLYVQCNLDLVTLLVSAKTIAKSTNVTKCMILCSKLKNGL